MHRGLPADFGGNLDALHPAISVVGGAIVRGLFLTGTFALAAAFLGAELRVRWLRLALFLVAAAAMVSDWGNGADFAKQFLGAALILGVVILGIRNVVRFNLLGFFLVVASGAMLGGAVELLKQSDAFYRSQGYWIVLALLGLLGWPMVTWRMGSGKKAAA